MHVECIPNIRGQEMMLVLWTIREYEKLSIQLTSPLQRKPRIRPGNDHAERLADPSADTVHVGCVLHKYQVEGDNSVSAPNSVPKPSRGTTPTVDSKVRLLRKNHGNMEDLGGDKRDRRGGQKKYRVVKINTEPSNVAVWKRQYKQIGRNVTRSTLLWHSEILAATESCETQPNRGTISQ